jgi:hypothetical protein
MGARSLQGKHFGSVTCVIKTKRYNTFLAVATTSPVKHLAVHSIHNSDRYLFILSCRSLRFLPTPTKTRHQIRCRHILIPTPTSHHQREPIPGLHRESAIPRALSIPEERTHRQFASEIRENRQEIAQKGVPTSEKHSETKSSPMLCR